MDKLEKVFGKGWAEELKPFLRSEEFDRIGVAIKALQIAGKTLTPEMVNIFRAFKECPWHVFHTIILSSGPYVGVDASERRIADGLCFSARITQVPPSNLQAFTEKIIEEVYDNNVEQSMLGWDNDLTYLANEGVLLLNCSLTAVVGQSPTAHIDIWKPFISYVMRMINAKKSNIGVVLIGNFAKAYQHLLDNTSFAVYSCEHPNEAKMRNKTWDTENVFKHVTAYHEAINNIHIKW